MSADDGIDELSVASHAADRGRRGWDGGVVRRSDGIRARASPARRDPGRGARRERGGPPRGARGSRDRRATSRSSTPGRRSTSRRRRRRAQEGVAKAREAIDSGAARDVLGRLVARSKELSGGELAAEAQLRSTRKTGHDRRAGRGGADRSGRTQRRGPARELQRRLAEQPEQRRSARRSCAPSCR